MRVIVLDTETTGLVPLRGDRLVEIGCVEIFNRMPTGQTFHVYINPERDMPQEAFAVHGLSSEFLADKPLFAQDKRFVFFCAGGLRSALAAQAAHRMGLKPVAHIRGGFGAWKTAGGPVEAAEPPKPKS